MFIRESHSLEKTKRGRAWEQQHNDGFFAHEEEVDCLKGASAAPGEDVKQYSGPLVEGHRAPQSFHDSRSH
jgi:hypothetical protein